MANQNNDIEKYLRGELTPAEMHALEKKALLDPFLAEALEGAQHVDAENFALDIDLIQQSVHEKTKKKGSRIIPLNGWNVFTGVAAGLLLLVVSSFMILLMIRQQNENNEIASAEQHHNIAEEKSQAPKKDVITDSLIAENTTPNLEKKPIPQTPSNKNRLQPKARQTDSGSIALSERASAQPIVNNAYGEEREQVVEAELQEPPLIVRDENLAKKEIATTKPKEALAPSQNTSEELKSSLLPERTVRGKVLYEDDGKPLPGVNVIVKDSNKGTVTDVNGDFEILVSGGEKTLVFNFIGLTTQEVNIGNNTSVDVRMSDEVMALSEVVVTGYNRGTPEGSYEMAFPQGGRRAFNKYLEEKLQYPEQAKENKIEGRVTIQFTVQPNGSLTDFEVLKGLGYGCDEELIRLVKQGPSWNPSKRNNEVVQEKVRVRLRFKLPEK